MCFECGSNWFNLSLIISSQLIFLELSLVLELDEYSTEWTRVFCSLFSSSRTSCWYARLNKRYTHSQVLKMSTTAKNSTPWLSFDNNYKRSLQDNISQLIFLLSGFILPLSIFYFHKNKLPFLNLRRITWKSLTIYNFVERAVRSNLMQGHT